MSLAVVVDITEVDVTGVEEEQRELWIGLTEKEVQFLRHCQDVESKITRGPWGAGMFARFCALRERTYDPRNYRDKLKKLVVDEYIEVFIGSDNATELDDTEESEDADV